MLYQLMAPITVAADFNKTRKIILQKKITELLAITKSTLLVIMTKNKFVRVQ